MNPDELRGLLQWHREYRPEWDNTPGNYVEQGVVAWGKTRRLGAFKVGRSKGYLGVQHVDPGLTAWSDFDAPTARFFVSLFVDGRIVTLRTFPTVPAALQWVASRLG